VIPYSYINLLAYPLEHYHNSDRTFEAYSNLRPNSQPSSTFANMVNSLLIASSLLPILAIAAALPPLPLFTLRDITYSSEIIYSTPAHLAVSDATISFNLTNKALPYTTHCTATSLRYPDFFYGELVYKCDAPSGAGIGPAASANFTFSYPDGVFSVNQTWEGEGFLQGKT
jgi:hypothetical protein